MAVVWAVVRRHQAFVLLGAAGLLLRAAVMAAYPPAFWYHGDSGDYLGDMRHLLPAAPYHPMGYPVALRVVYVLYPSITAVALLQHLLGAAIAVAVYALLTRRGVARWLSCLAAAPVLFDSLQITVEHYVLTEAFFTAPLTGALLVLLWPRKPGYAACGAAGALLALAWVTRPSTLPLIAAVLAYLVLRRVGWGPFLVGAFAFAAPWTAVNIWAAGSHGAYSGSYANRALYSRVAVFADCDRLALTAAERALCPAEPLGRRPDRPWRSPPTTTASCATSR